MDKAQWRAELGKRLGTIRRLLGMKQDEVADDTGIKPYRISRLENAKSNLEHWEAVRLARKYRCTLSAFNCDLPLGDVHQLLPGGPEA